MDLSQMLSDLPEIVGTNYHYFIWAFAIGLGWRAIRALRQDMRRAGRIARLRKNRRF